MKIVHITYTTAGGAGIAVCRLHGALMAQGVESKILVAQSSIQSPDIVKVGETYRNRRIPPKNRIAKKLFKTVRQKGKFMTPMESMEYELVRLDRNYPAYFDLPLSSYELEKHPLIAWADVVHIHWISGFVDFPSFFSSIKKPILWTMHDLNPLYGGFHHFRLREKYLCYYENLENKCYVIKKQAVENASNLSIVAISSQMHRLIAGHEFYKNKKLFDIHNCIDPKQFPFLKKDNVRNVLGWPENERCFLFVNVNMNDTEKGFAGLVEALEHLALDNARLICVGNGVVPKSDRIKIFHYSAVKDTIWLAMLYTAADFLVMPSHQEAFPSTPIEAMCCGTPVVITPVSGAEDMINDENGVVADGFSSKSIADAILAAMQKSYKRETIRQGLIDKFSPEIIARKYIAAYKEILL